jgi:hypothetical protein
MSLVFFLLSYLFGVYTLGKGVSGSAKVERLPLLKEVEGVYELSPSERQMKTKCETCYESAGCVHDWEKYSALRCWFWSYSL